MGAPLQPTPGCCHPSLPRRPLTFVGVREPDLGGAGVGPAERRLWRGGGGAGGVAGGPRAQAAAQEAPHEGGGGCTAHQAAASCRGRGEGQGGLPVPPSLHARSCTARSTLVHVCPSCTHAPLVRSPAPCPRSPPGLTHSQRSRARGTASLTPGVSPGHTWDALHTRVAPHAAAHPVARSCGGTLTAPCARTSPGSPASPGGVAARLGTRGQPPVGSCPRGRHTAGSGAEPRVHTDV